ncbi:extracellular solute-binding protein [Marinicrinis lubricantis]|uniref:Extracellular solute-binding protein n=1 Tax=Marinicrinis lubricantis TaxID=2086470 RepID=A0ABW1IHH4_9BACL
MKLKKMFVLTMCLVLAIFAAACSSGNNNNNNSNSNPTNNAVNNTENTGGNAGTDNAGSEAESEDIVPEEGAKLIVWEGQEQKAFLEEMGKQFEEKYGIPVEYQEVGSGDQMTKLKTDGPAGLGADVIITPHDHLGELTAAGLILPNDFYAQETMDNFVESAVNAVTMDGILWGYPRNMETYLLYYNKDLVSEDQLASWESIIEFAKSYNDPGSNKFGFMFDVDDFYYVYSFIAGNGGYVFGENGTDPTDVGLNNDQAVEAMQFYQTLREALPIKAADATGDVKTELFQSGKLPINMDGIWQLGNFTQEKLGFEVGAVPLPPMPNGNKPVSFAGVKSYFVSSFSKYPNAAKLFIHFVTSQEAMEKNYEMAGIIPARNGMEESAIIQQNPLNLAFLEQFKTSQAMPAIIEMRSVWPPMTAALEPIWNGEDVKTVLDKAVADVKIGIEQSAN